ncbi:MAG: AMP-binding protein [Burkholderiaceae bacterium]|nr:AMP-binding protein [Burkholderiaceae bacterium]
MAIVDPSKLALQRLYHFERSSPGTVTLTQPMGGGVVKDFTWGQVADQVRRMAAHLQAMGREQSWEPGARVAILSKNCAWWLMSDLAIWMAGYVSVPLYPTLAPETISQILKHSEARACFIGKLDGWEGMKPGVPAGLPVIGYALSPADVRKDYEDWDAICARTAPLQGELLRDGADLATLIYTSGTTGNPKGVMHSFEAFSWALEAGVKRIPFGAHDRMLSYLPLAHVVERVLVEHGWLMTGVRLFFAESLDTFAADLQRAQPTVFFSVPRLWVKFQQGVHAKMPPAKLQRLLSIPLIGGIVRRKIQKALGLDQCRIAVGGAAPMPVALLEWYARLGIPINEGYGMTENLAVSHITTPGENQRGSVGMPYDGVEARIAPDSGELQMRSPAVMLGYYKEPELSREALTADGWLRTGDKGRIDAKGCLHITGRVKDLFKTSKGKYVAPAPIEDRLMQHPDVEACVVTGANLGQPLGIALLSADAVARAADAGTRTEMEAGFAAHLDAINVALDPHEQMDCLVLLKTPWTVDNGCITPTFKVKRNRIEDLFAARYETWVASKKKIIWGD